MAKRKTKKRLKKQVTNVLLLIPIVVLLAIALFSTYSIFKPTTTAQETPDFDPSLSGVQIYNQEKAFDGYNLYEGKLIDMQGNIVNEWNNAIYLGYISSDGYYYGQECFECPKWGKYTWNDTPVWEIEFPVIHHEIIEGPNGTIFTMGKEVHDYNGRNVEFDTILEYDANGTLLNTWSTWDNLEYLQSFHRPLELDKPKSLDLADNTYKNTSIWGGNYDYYHLNSMSFVPQTDLEGYHPAFNPGNWIISFRHGSMTFILDKDTQEVHWTGIHNQVPGTLEGQHTPFMLENGNIIMLDNGRWREWSRVIELNPVTMQIEWEYKNDDFYTLSQGQAQPLPNGNILVTESEPGRVFEITRDKEIVWEYYHPGTQNETNSVVEEQWGKRQQIYRMTRYSSDFIEGLPNRQLFKSIDIIKYRMITKNTLKSFFLTHPSAKKRVRELERELNLSLPSVIRYVEELCSENILEKQFISNITVFSANTSSLAYKHEKILYNIKELYDSGLVEHIKKELSNPTIILFGSYLRGEDVEESDIDLFISSNHKLDLSSFEKKLNKKIQIFGYSKIIDIKNTDLANNIINGYVLNGFIEVL